MSSMFSRVASLFSGELKSSDNWQSNNFTMLKDENGKMYGYESNGKRYINNNSQAYNPGNFGTLSGDGSTWNTGGFSTENSVTSIKLDDGSRVFLYNNNGETSVWSPNTKMNISENRAGVVTDVKNVGNDFWASYNVNTSNSGYTNGSYNVSSSSFTTPNFTGTSTNNEASHKLQLYVNDDGALARYHVDNEEYIHHTFGSDDFGKFSEDSVIKSKIHINGTNTDVFVYTDANGKYQAKTSDGSPVDVEFLGNISRSPIETPTVSNTDHDFTMIKNEKGQISGYILDGKEYKYKSPMTADELATLNGNSSGWSKGGFSNENSLTYKKLEDGTVIRFYNDGNGNIVALSSNGSVNISESVNGKVTQVENVGANYINSTPSGNVFEQIDAIAKAQVSNIGAAGVAATVLGGAMSAQAGSSGIGGISSNVSGTKVKDKGQSGSGSSTTSGSNKGQSGSGSSTTSGSNKGQSGSGSSTTSGSNKGQSGSGSSATSGSNKGQSGSGSSKNNGLIKGNDGKTYTVDELADMVIAGKFGAGDERKQRLGSHYDAVQSKVNEKVYGTPAKVSGNGSTNVNTANVAQNNSNLNTSATKGTPATYEAPSSVDNGKGQQVKGAPSNVRNFNGKTTQVDTKTNTATTASKPINNGAPSNLVKNSNGKVTPSSNGTKTTTGKTSK